MTQQLLQFPERARPAPARDREAEPAVLLMTTEGIVVECDPAAERLFGYLSDELEGISVGSLLPDLAGRPLMERGSEGIEPRLAYLCRCGNPFRAVRRDGAQFPAQLCPNVVRPADKHLVRMIVRPAV